MHFLDGLDQRVCAHTRLHIRFLIVDWSADGSSGAAKGWGVRREVEEGGVVTWSLVSGE